MSDNSLRKHSSDTAPKTTFLEFLKKNYDGTIQSCSQKIADWDRRGIMDPRAQLLRRDHSFITYAKFFEKLTFLTHFLPPTCVYQGVINISFSENCAYVVNEWSRICYLLSENSHSRIFWTCWITFLIFFHLGSVQSSTNAGRQITWYGPLWYRVYSPLV